MIYFSSWQAKHNQIMPIHSDDSDGGGDEHVTGEMVTHLETNNTEQPGALQTEGPSMCTLTMCDRSVCFYSGVWNVWHHREY